MQRKIKNLFIATCCLVIVICSGIQCMEMNQNDPTVSGLGKSSFCAPGPQEWKDDLGNLAPPRVRKAADDLWESVKVEGAAAFDAGWGMGKKMPWGCKRGCLCCLTCGIMECMIATKGKYDEFGWNQTLHQQRVSEGRIYEQRTQEVTQALTYFKEAVNSSVTNPEQYSGDANIGMIGSWIEDSAWQYDGGLFVSGRRDLSGLFQTTKVFVNSHGGWVAER